MKLVCVETARMEAVRIQQLPYVFQRLPLNAHGNLPLSEVRLYILGRTTIHTLHMVHRVCSLELPKNQHPQTMQI